MDKNNFLKDCINIVKELDVKNESQTIAKEVILSELKNLQQRINKAIEYINQKIFDMNVTGKSTLSIDKLLSILQDKEIEENE